MALGYDRRLYIAAFDHRGSFETQLFGLKHAPSASEAARIADAKALIYEGFLAALDDGALRPRAAARPDAAHARGAPGARRRAGRVEDRGARSRRGLRANRRSGAIGGPRRGRVRGPGPRRGRHAGRRVAARRRERAWL